MLSSSYKKKLALKSILFTVILLVCVIMCSHYILSGFSLASKLFLSRLFFWLVVVVMFVYAKSVEKESFLMWAESSGGVKFYFVSVIALLICTLIGSVTIATILKSLALGDHSDIIKQIMSLGLAVKLFAVFTAAVTEELIFRGYLMPRLQLFSKSAAWPIIISSILFGLAHIGFGTVLNMAVPLFIGIVFAMYYQKYRNIKVLIVCHFLIDFYSLIIHH